MKVGQDPGYAPHVAGMSVSTRQHVDRRKSGYQKVWRHYIFPDIQFRMHPEGNTAGIHQERATFGRNHKDGIALAYIDGGNFEHSRLDPRMWWNCADPESAG